MDSITLKQVLDFMDSGQPFTISFITWDDSRQTGGELIDIAKAWKHQPLTYAQRKLNEKSQPRTTGFRKNPNHYENSTRNLKLPNGQIRKVHIRLIRSFNGKTVL